MDKQNLISWSHNLCSGELGLVKIFRNISYGGESAKLPRLPSRGWWWRSHCWRTVSPPHPSSLGQIRLLTSRRENLNRKKGIQNKNLPSINLLTQCAHTHDVCVLSALRDQGRNTDGQCRVSAPMSAPVHCPHHPHSLLHSLTRTEHPDESLWYWRGVKKEEGK